MSPVRIGKMECLSQGEAFREDTGCAAIGYRGAAAEPRDDGTTGGIARLNYRLRPLRSGVAASADGRTALPAIRQEISKACTPSMGDENAASLQRLGRMSGGHASGCPPSRPPCGRAVTSA